VVTSALVWAGQMIRSIEFLHDAAEMGRAGGSCRGVVAPGVRLESDDRRGLGHGDATCALPGGQRAVRVPVAS